MRILITGGTGFIGSRLGLRLLEQGAAVRVLALRNTPAEAANARELVDRGAELIEGSVEDAGLREESVRGVDVVHHVAALMREASVADVRFRDVNVTATRELVRASERAGVRRFVYCSSIGVVGAIRGRRVDETEPYRPKDVYGRTKAAAEEWVLRHARETGFPITAVRPADVYGPGDQRFVKMFRMIRKGRFFFLGNGRGTRHMVYIDDLIEGMLAAQENDAALGEAFFLAGPAPIRLRDLTAIMARALDAPAPSLRLPYRPFWLLGALLEAGCRPFGIEPPIHRRRVEFYAHDYHYDISKARDRLGFAPRIDVPEGVRRTLEAYRRDGLLD